MGKIFCQICARSAHHERIAQSPYVRGPGPALGPWKQRVFWCSQVHSGPIFEPFCVKFRTKISEIYSIKAKKGPNLQLTLHIQISASLLPNHLNLEGTQHPQWQSINSWIHHVLRLRELCHLDTQHWPKVDDFQAEAGVQAQESCIFLR